MAAGVESLGSPSDASQFRSHPQKCPYYAGLTVVSEFSHFALLTGDAIFAELMSHPAVVAQTECKWRIARDRSRQKRGPPFLLL
jgi:hypothetical protein